jgi:5-formyltetrahydrofolate cyclo-ligase
MCGSKSAIRKFASAGRNALSARDRKAKSAAIMELLFAAPEYKNALRVMFYVSFRSEVDTHGMINAALKAGKKVFIPVTDKNKHELLVSELKDLKKDLEPSSRGILEPKKGRMRKACPEEMDLILIPGVAFDLDGNRIGYGGGYYDRLLGKTGKKTERIGLCFESQLFKAIPAGTTDKKVDILVTEKKKYIFS